MRFASREPMQARTKTEAQDSQHFSREARAKIAHTFAEHCTSVLSRVLERAPMFRLIPLARPSQAVAGGARPA